MKRFAYFGTVGKPNPAWLPSCGAAGEPSGASWSNAAERVLRLSLCCGDGIELLIRDECAVFLQGYAVGGPEELTGPDRREFLARVLDNYLHDGRFAPQQYDGSFTLVLLDGRNARVEMFRNLVGNAFSYYGKTPGGFVFGSNLADLARRSGLPLRPDAEMLPVYFIYRFVPGGNTLFEGIKRLQPGEHVSYHDGRLSARQVQTFADFDEPRKTDERESIERVEAAMAEVAGNLLAIAPEAAGLLSGGVDSTYIQAHWNRLWRATNNSGKPKSAAVWLDDPATAPDQEYALSAVRELDTDHVAVRVTGLDSRQMSATLRAVGEMPNHVQSFYFGPLAEAMLRKGISAGLCGEGADGLFGNDDAAFLQYCSGLRERVPTRALRRLGEGASRIFRHLHASRAFRLSNVLGNESDADHPLNSAAAFTDFALVAACFGRGAVAAALQHRRTLLDRYRAADDAAGIQRVLAIGYLAEAVNTAAYWNHLACEQGVQIFCPFMDSRIIRTALNIRIDARFVPGNPKQVLKKALAKHVPEEFVSRPKRGFGQPIFKWLAEGGPLCSAVDKIGDYGFIDRRTRARAKDKPNWFLYNLLIYDLWHKAFIDKCGTRTDIEADALLSEVRP